MKKRDCTIRVAKTKALISFAVTAPLFSLRQIIWFSHDAAHMYVNQELSLLLTAINHHSSRMIHLPHLYHNSWLGRLVGKGIFNVYFTDARIRVASPE